MKKQLYIPLFAAVLLFSSCDNFLEIEPEDVVLNSETLNNEQDAQYLLNSSYAELASGNFLGGNHYILSELMADALTNNFNNEDRRSYYDRKTSQFNGTTRSYWESPYKVIYRANTLLENLDEIEGLDQNTKDRMAGEAEFLRALCHFEMVRMFGKPYLPGINNSQPGVPLRLETGIELLPRSSVEEVYSQVITDLEAAIAKLPTSDAVYADKWAAKALLAKVYFQMNDFDNAFNLADDVINNGGFSMTPEVGDKYQKPFGSTEGIFELVSYENYNSAGGIFGAYNWTGSAPTHDISADFTASFPVNATRTELFFAVQNNGDIFPTKWNPQDQATNFLNVPYLHLTQLRLMRAECIAEIGGDVNVAQQDLSDIRVRAGGTPVSTSDLVLLKEIAREERKQELFLEGDRLHELKRIGALDTPNLLVRDAPWDCNGMVVQFPDTELSGNINLVPNEEGCN